MVTALWQMVHKIPQVSAVGELPCPRHREDKPVSLPLDKLERQVGCKPCIALHHNLSDPFRRSKFPQHSSKQYVLLSMSSGVYDSNGHWNSEMLPTGYQQNHLESEGVVRVIVQSGLTPHRVLLPALSVQRRITNKMKHSVRGG